MDSPRYQSARAVWSLQIKEIRPDRETGGAFIIPNESGYSPIPVTKPYLDSANPKVGGYWVLYEDGSQTWSAEDVFDKEHKPEL